MRFHPQGRSPSGTAAQIRNSLNRPLNRGKLHYLHVSAAIQSSMAKSPLTTARSLETVAVYTPLL